MAKIAIFSDSHDNLWHLEKALAQVREFGADALLHCGDLCAPFVVKWLAEGFQGPIHLVFGNNDGDGRLIQVQTSRYDHVTHHGPYAELNLFGVRVAMIHYPEPATRIAQSQAFDLVCYGHDHTQHREQIGHTLLVNPGEIMGFKHAPTWALYDTETRALNWVEVPTSLAHFG